MCKTEGKLSVMGCDWLVEAGWNKEPPAPLLPPEVVEATTRRYREAYERLTGKKLG
jgi:phosphoribosylaminoimidazole-succinocarboxamide synthase